MVGNKERWYIYPGQNGVVFCCCCSLFCFFLACVPQSVEVYGTGYKVLERHGLCLTTKACIKENGYSEEWYLLRGTAWGPDKTCLIMANTVITVLYSKIPTNTGCLAGKDDFFLSLSTLLSSKQKAYNNNHFLFKPTEGNSCLKSLLFLLWLYYSRILFIAFLSSLKQIFTVVLPEQKLLSGNELFYCCDHEQQQHTNGALMYLLGHWCMTWGKEEMDMNSVYTIVLYVNMVS